MANELIVYWEGRAVGVLRVGEKRALSFTYSDSWLTDPQRLPVSLSLPLQKEPFSDDRARPFFSNLLPEARVREMIARELGVSEQNDFKLLEALGGDCAGALSLLPPELKPDAEGAYDPLPPEKLNQLIRESPKRPLLSPHDGLRISLAGVQNKLSVYRESEKFFLPRGAFPSSHILKPPIAGVDHSVENEVFVMTLAGRLGLPVPPVEVWRGDGAVFLTERYDRFRGPAGPLKRLHQEDFCQALGLGADQKYESDGGITLQACFALVDKFAAAPAADKNRLLQWTLFNYLIGNNDAHGKNLSLLISGDGVKLAPFYDLLSTAVYPGLSQKFAMKIGGENRQEWVMRRHWERLAQEANVAFRAILDSASLLLKAWPAAFAKTKEMASLQDGRPVIEMIEAHAEKTTKHLRTVLFG